MRLFFFLSLFALLVSAEEKRVTLQLSWLHQFQFAGYYMAVQKGYYKEAGIDLIIKEYTPANLNIPSDFTLHKSDVLIDATENNDILLLGASFQKSPMVLLSANLNVLSPKDVENRRVMITKGASSSASIMGMLAASRVDLSKVAFQKHSFRVEDLIEGRTDFMASYLSNELLVLQEKKIPYKVLDPSDYGFGFYDDFLTTTKSFEANNPELTKAFYEATIRGWEYAYSHIEESARVIYERYNTQHKELYRLIQEGEVLKTLAYDKKGEIGTITLQKLQEMVGVFKVLSYIKSDVIAEDLIYKHNKETLLSIEIDKRVMVGSIVFLFLLVLVLYLMYRDRKSKVFLESLMNNMGEGVFSVDASGELTWINPKALEMLGYKLSDVLAQAHELFHHHKQSGERYEFYECPVTLTMLDKEIRESEEYFIRSDGTFFPVLLVTAPVEDGVIALFRDITEEKKVHKILEDSHEVLQQISEQVPGLIYQCQHFNDGRKKVLFASKALAEIFEVSQAEAREDANIMYGRIVEEQREDFNAAMAKASQNYNVLRYDFRVALPLKGMRYLRLMAKPQLQEDGTLIWNGYVEDITEIEESHRELIEKDKIMIAQSRNAAMGEMINMIAHQWRQPISTISMAVNNILVNYELEIDDAIATKKSLQEILYTTQELSKTIEDFRNFFKQERELETAVVDRVIEDALHVVEGSLLSDGIEVVSSMQAPKGVRIFSRELMHVIINILTNAKEALAQSRSENRKIYIVTHQQEESTKITICDNAGGIKDEIFTHIFEPYATTKGHSNGTGLGLYISKVIIEQHLRGSLHAMNTKEGACFEIMLLQESRDKEELV